jgi:hypothetical protein
MCKDVPHMILTKVHNGNIIYVKAHPVIGEMPAAQEIEVGKPYVWAGTRMSLVQEWKRRGSGLEITTLNNTYFAYLFEDMETIREMSNLRLSRFEESHRLLSTYWRPKGKKNKTKG